MLQASRIVESGMLYPILLGVAALFLLPFVLFFAVRSFTGRHMLGFALALFGMIIAVNVVMAFQAVHTFPGLEADNGYVSSQNFNTERAAQDKLGWKVTPSYDGQELAIRIIDPTGQPAPVGDLVVNIGRPTHVRDDQTPPLSFSDGAWRAPLKLAPGAWIIHISARAPDGTSFRQRFDHFQGDRVK